MKAFLTTIILLITTYTLSSQTIEDLTFGDESTLEVATWNLEWFPKNGQETLENVRQIIEALDIDVWAFQEINDTTAFKELIDNLEGYEGYFKSNYYGGLQLAYIYKSATIQIKDIYEIYTSSAYWSPFPRAPKVMEMSFKDENYIIINNHFKCCGNGVLELNNAGDEETRRYTASNLLKQYIDSYFPNEKVIVLGDFNDILTDIPSNNVFQVFIDDFSNYFFADTGIGSDETLGWSYPTWPSHIDHILVTNELFDNYDPDSDNIQTIKIENYLGGWYYYDANISDHRPLAIKITPSLISEINTLNSNDFTFSIYPNPFKELTTISFNTVTENAKIEIYNLNGQKVHSISIPEGKSSIVWNAENFPDGIYFTKLISNGNVMGVKKVILNK